MNSTIYTIACGSEEGDGVDFEEVACIREALCWVEGMERADSGVVETIVMLCW